MNTWAREHINDPYSAMRNSCGDYAADVLRAGGLHLTTNPVGPTLPVDMNISKDSDAGRFNPRGY